MRLYVMNMGVLNGVWHNDFNIEWSSKFSEFPWRDGRFGWGVIKLGERKQIVFGLLGMKELVEHLDFSIDDAENWVSELMSMSDSEFKSLCEDYYDNEDESVWFNHIK